MKKERKARKKSSSTDPHLVINGERVEVRNLPNGYAKYRAMREEHPDFEIALIYNNLIYEANYAISSTIYKQ